jgi:hypothetical protein
LPQRDPALDFMGSKDVKLPAMPLVIEIDEKVEEARLVIPSAAFHFRAALDKENASEQRADIGTRPDVHLIMAGLSLSLALCLGGVWLVRRGSHLTINSETFPLAAVALAVVLATGVAAWSAAPRYAPGPAAGERVSVVIKANFDDKMRLIVNKKQLAKIVEQAK